MQCHPGAGDRVNLYGLVSYLPDPLGPFLDQMRRELVPACFAQSHLSVLPPRSLTCPVEAAHQQLTEALQDLSAFEVELQDVEVFDHTFVIYLGVGRGSDQLRAMHDRLNLKSLAFDEPHSFHPHITLAQNFELQQLDRLTRVAKTIWDEYSHPRTFTVDRLTFVQNTNNDRWLDLEEFALLPANASPTQTS